MQQQSPESWNEYKRLVLSELVRLNDCVEQLRTDSANFQQYNSAEMFRLLNKVENSMHLRMKEYDEQVHASISKDIEATLDKLTNLESEFKNREMGAYKNSVRELKKDKIAFYTAIVTIFGSLVVSIISLLLAIKN